MSYYGNFKFGWKSLVCGVGVHALLLAAGDAFAETLDDALVSAYATNPTILAERARLKSVDEDSAQARSGWRPSVSINTTYSQSQGKRNLARFLGSSSSALIKEHGERYSSTLVATQPLYRGGQTRAGIKASDSLVKAGRANLTAIEQNVLLNAITSYFDVLRDEATVNLTLNNVTVLQRQLQASQDRFSVGEITRTDVAQAQARLGRSQSELARSRAALAESRSRYEEIIGHLPQGDLKIPALPAVPASLEEATTQAKENNPNIVAAKQNETAAKYNVRQSKGSLLPSLEISASVDRSEDLDLVNSNDTNAQASLQMSLPIYQAGAEYSQIRQAKHIHSQRRLQVAETERDIHQQTSTAWNDLTAAKATIESDREQVRANEVAFEGVQQEAQVGSRTVLDVLDAEQELLDSRVALVRSRRDEYVAAYRLLAAIGGLTAQGLNLEADIYDPTENYEEVKWKVIGFGTENE